MTKTNEQDKKLSCHEKKKFITENFNLDKKSTLNLLLLLYQKIDTTNKIYEDPNLGCYIFLSEFTEEQIDIIYNYIYRKK